jgi:orotate phosphoribosyltransferase
MDAYKAEFIEFMVRCGVLVFGDFTTKSGRSTPYFINTGNYRSGVHLQRLAGFYTAAIAAHIGDRFNVLFGPAYKGIPLAVATAMHIAEMHNRGVGFCFDRKEAKDHGEGGVLIGHPLQDGDRVLIIEDVATAGTSVREAVPRLRAAADIKLAGLVVSVDRMERGLGERTALAELADLFQMPTFAIVTIDDVMTHLHNRSIDGSVVLDDALWNKMHAYRARYGGAA